MKKQEINLINKKLDSLYFDLFDGSAVFTYSKLSGLSIVANHFTYDDVVNGDFSSDVDRTGRTIIEFDKMDIENMNADFNSFVKKQLLASGVPTIEDIKSW